MTYPPPPPEGQPSPPPAYPDPTVPYPNYQEPAAPSYQAPGYEAQGYQAPVYPGYQAAAYPAPYPYVMQPPGPSTNGMAIAALVVSLFGILGLCAYGLGGWIGAIGAILGHVAKRQIAERGQSGDGMAMAGVIIGWIATGLFVLAGIGWGIFIWYAATHPEEFDGTTTTLIQLMAG